MYFELIVQSDDFDIDTLSQWGFINSPNVGTVAEVSKITKISDGIYYLQLDAMKQPYELYPASGPTMQAQSSSISEFFNKPLDMLAAISNSNCGIKILGFKGNHYFSWQEYDSSNSFKLRTYVSMLAEQKNAATIEEMEAARKKVIAEQQNQVRPQNAVIAATSSSISLSSSVSLSASSSSTSSSALSLIASSALFSSGNQSLKKEEKQKPLSVEAITKEFLQEQKISPEGRQWIVRKRQKGNQDQIADMRFQGSERKLAEALAQRLKDRGYLGVEIVVGGEAKDPFVRVNLSTSKMPMAKDERNEDNYKVNM